MDWEGMILARQEAMEIWEDEPESDFLTDEDRELFTDLYFNGGYYETN